MNDGAFRRLLGVFVANGIAAALPATLFLFFVADVLQLERASGPLLALYFVAGAASLPIWVTLSARFGRVHAWLGAMGLSIIAFAGASLLGSGDLWPFAAICVASGLALGADLALPAAIAADPQFDTSWREWILSVRRRLGMVDLADMIYVRSEHYRTRHESDPERADQPLPPVLFGDKEGRIALANRRKDPLYLFSALNRHLNYPSVPRPKKEDAPEQRLDQMARRIERLEAINRSRALTAEEMSTLARGRYPLRGHAFQAISSPQREKFAE
mgnify:CR=1 FL=1